ncbi:MAG: hypothetical protein IPM29_16785 [Planctomycetes bacterium]|nr:hypothetical protein [Planctomycetota bacterium]
MVAALLATATGALRAQIPFGGTLFQDQQQRRDQRQTFDQPSLLGPDPAEMLRDLVPQGFAPPDRAEPLFQGFPLLTPPGFSAYPGGRLPNPYERASGAMPVVPPPALPISPNAWPSWFVGPGSENPEGFTATVAVLAQNTDLVWLRPEQGAPFAPLALHDRFEVIRVGARVDVRGGGQYLMAFQGGATLRMEGTSRVEIEQLDDDRIALELTDLYRVWLAAGDRPLVARFGPGGAELTLRAAQAVLQRDRGFVRCENRGPGVARLAAIGREFELPAGFVTTVLLRAPATDAPSASLEVRGDVETARDGRVLEARAVLEAGSVGWTGARFELAPGASLRIDPLAGAEFPDQRDTER